MWNSLCEYFLGTQAYVFFATHFSEMAQELDAMYPNLKANHFNVLTPPPLFFISRSFHDI